MDYGFSTTDFLFIQYDVFSFIENKKAHLQNEVSGIPEEQLLNTSVEDLVKYFIEKYRIEVPELDVENAVADQHEAAVEVSGFRYGLDEGETRSVPGTKVTLELPFAGEPNMFRVKPSTHTTSPPRAEIRDQLLVLKLRGTNLNTQDVQATLDRTIGEIERYLGWLRSDIEQLNNQLSEIARQSIDNRREKLLANQSLVAGLKFKLK